MFLEALEPRALLASLAPLPDNSPVKPSSLSSVVGPRTPSLESTFTNFYPQTVFQSPLENQYLSPPATGEPVEIARNYLKANGVALGLNGYDVDAAAVTNNYVTEATGVRHIYFQQRWNGLRVQGGLANVSLNADGQVLTASASFQRNLHLVYPGLATAPTPEIDALTAFTYFTSLGGGSTPSVKSTTLTGDPQTDPTQNGKIVLQDGDRESEVKVKLEYTPRPNGTVQLAWNFEFRTLNGWHYYDASVGAAGPGVGSVVQIFDLVKNATYQVYPRPLESPQDGVPNPTRTILTDPFDPVASRFGWHDLNGVVGPDTNLSQGNNAIVFYDDPTFGTLLANGGAGLTFEYPLDLTLQPIANLPNNAAALAQAFYTVNTVHDIAFRYGFDEAAGNFQVRNYTGQGLGFDPLNVNAIDIVNIDNAFILPLADGLPADMNLGLFSFTFPWRFSAFENQIVIHEYAHGITDRLTGGPANDLALQSFQAEGLAEGWSDFFAVVFTLKATDTRDTPIHMGPYTLGNPNATGPGIRRNPYSFNKIINPITFDDIYRDYPASYSEHDDGEIWASALIDMMWLLVEKYGYDPNLSTGTGGNNLALRLVMDALKLQPANPTYMQARDAILAADLALTGGNNYDIIWTAMARRGMGRGATAGINSDSYVTIAKFDTPRFPGKITGTVYQDLNGDRNRDAGEGPFAAPVTVFFDADNDGALDPGEQRTTTRADGSYELTSFGTSVQRVRAVAPTDYFRTEPNPGPGYDLVFAPGITYSGNDFGFRERPGEIHGTKFLDTNGNGTRDAGEGGQSGVWIYADVNNDGKRGAGEPAAVTGADGVFMIKDVRPGTYVVREAITPGYVATFPLATANSAAGVHTGVVVNRNAITNLINFGNAPAFDYGDAPNSYGTLQASGGPVHAGIPGFGLGANLDFESDGNPLATALGDDTLPAAAPDDEDGVRFINVTLGQNGAVGSGMVDVTVRTSGYSPGVLSAWIDFNRDGDFLDDGEKIFTDRELDAGVHRLPFVVPAGAGQGMTVSRFRYSYSRNLGPTTAPNALPAYGGEVEDHPVDLLKSDPVANDDLFPDAAFGDPIIKAGPTPLVLNVLRNDLGVSNTNGTTIPPTINTFDAVSTRGGALALGTGVDAGKLIYTRPANDFVGNDTFTYDVIANGKVSSRATVSITISAGDPIAVDNTFTILTNSAAQSFDVLVNDLPRTGLNITAVAQPAYPMGTATATPVTIVNNQLRYTPPANFRGTVQFTYTVDDVGNVNTNPSTGTVTVQVVDALTTPAPTHLARLRAELTDANGVVLPAGANITVGDVVQVRLYGQDLRTGGGPANRGLDSAFVDLLYNSLVAEAVFVSGAPDITFANPYTLQQTVRANRPEGLYDESGAFNGRSAGAPPTGTGEVLVYTARFRTRAAGDLQFVADPADGVQNQAETQIVLAPDTPPTAVPLADTQVFLISTAGVRVNPAGAGEFTNSGNSFDVNGDGFATGLDAVVIVDELNSRGPRRLGRFSFSGDLPANYYDVNRDAFITGLDATLIVGYLNSLRGGGEFVDPAAAPPAPSALFGAEGEAVDAATLALVGDDLGSNHDAAPPVAGDPADEILSTTSAPPAAPLASTAARLLQEVASDPTAKRRLAQLRNLDATSVDSALDQLFGGESGPLRRRSR